MIEAGRGMEKPNETRTKDDELSQRINSVNDRLRTINIEISSRTG